MKINNFISVLLIITMCFILCMISGCNGASENNSSVDNDSSYVEIVESTFDEVESSGEVADTDVSDNYSDVATESAPDSNVSNEVNSVESQPESKPESQPITSTPDETPSEDTPAVDNSKPTDAIVETSTYPTIKLEVPTTYYGYKGYFTLNDNLNDIHLVELGLASDNLDGSIASTEYCDIVTGKTVGFVFASTMTEYKDLLYNHVFVVGVGTKNVTAIY